MDEQWPVLAILCILSVGVGLRLWLAPPPPNALVGYRARGVTRGPLHVWEAANRLLGRHMVVCGLAQTAALALFVWASPAWLRIAAFVAIFLLLLPPVVRTDRAVKSWQATSVKTATNEAGTPPPPSPQARR